MSTGGCRCVNAASGVALPGSDGRRGAAGVRLTRTAREGGPVMSGPQDPAATGLDGLRAGHADREHAIKALKHAFVQGRLTRDELGARAGRAFTARTYGD